MFCIASALLFATVAASAQSHVIQPATLVGSVTDSAGHAVPGVEISLQNTDISARTNEVGGFRMTGLRPGAAKVIIRRMGFEQISADVKLKEGQSDSLVVTMLTVATSLPGIVVEEEAMTRSKKLLAGFWQRRSNGFGHFLTREEIEAKDAHDFADLVRMTPGVSIQNNGMRKIVRFTREGGARGLCPPLYYVDGVRMDGATPDEFPPSNLEAVELYSGASTIPSQFAPPVVQTEKTCGVIVVWTRLPGT